MKHLRVSWDVDQKQLIVKDKSESAQSIVVFEHQERLIDIIREDSTFTKDQKWQTFNWLLQRGYGYHEKFCLTTFKLYYN